MAYVRICLLTFKQKESVRNFTYAVAYINHSMMLKYVIRSLNICNNLDAALQNSVGKK